MLIGGLIALGVAVLLAIIGAIASIVILFSMGTFSSSKSNNDSDRDDEKKEKKKEKKYEKPDFKEHSNSDEEQKMRTTKYRKNHHDEKL